MEMSLVACVWEFTELQLGVFVALTVDKMTRQLLFNFFFNCWSTRNNNNKKKSCATSSVNTYRGSSHAVCVCQSFLHPYGRVQEFLHAEVTENGTKVLAHLHVRLELLVKFHLLRFLHDNHIDITVKRSFQWQVM